MSDQLKLTGTSNTSISSGRWRNSDIHSRTISNLLNLTTDHQNKRERYRRKQAKKPKNETTVSDVDAILENSKNGVITETTLKPFVSLTWILPDAHLNVGTLVNLPEIQRKQFQDMMDNAKDQTLNSERTEPEILTPDMIRDFHNELQQFKNKSILTTTENSKIKNNEKLTTIMSDVSTSSTSTANNGNLDEYDSLNFTPTTNTVLNNNKYETSTVGTNTGDFTRQSPESVTVTSSSEELYGTVTSVDNITVDTINTGFDGVENLNGNNTDFGLKPHDDLDHLNNGGALKTNTNTSLVQNRGHGRPNSVDSIIFPSKRFDRRKRRRERQAFCRRINFGDAYFGFNCCMRNLGCFDNLPKTLDDTVFHHAKTKFGAAERLHLCHDIDDSLLCMGRVLDRPSCRKVASIINNEIQPEMREVKLFYQNTCSTGPIIPTIAPLPGTTTPTGHNSLGSTGFGQILSPIIPFIGGAFAGLFVLAVVMLSIIYCRKRCKKSQRNATKRDEMDSDSTKSYMNRRKSSVYEEIDVGKMVPVSKASKKQKKSSNVTNCGSRKLPSAPNEDDKRIVNHYYLSPTSSLPDDKQKTENDKPVTQSGYLDLQTDDNGQSYAKLRQEGEYITPNEIASLPPPKSDNSTEEYHMYFVLEKETDDVETESITE